MSRIGWATLIVLYIADGSRPARSRSDVVTYGKWFLQ